jgi:hypothetical protein
LGGLAHDSDARPARRRDEIFSAFMVARYGPKFDGSERKVATACKTPVDAAGTAMPFNGRGRYEFWSNVPHRVPSRASFVET